MNAQFPSLPRRAFLLAGVGVLGVSACGTTGGLLRPATPPTKYEFATREVRFSNNDVGLAGTLYTPVGATAAPGVVFGHGSGDVARTNRRYTFEAEGLAALGIACLVFDKRGSGQSSGDWKTSTFHDLAADLRAAFEFMRVQPGIDADKVGVRGASQAGWVMPLAASQAPRPAFMIMTSGAMITIGEQIAYQSETAINAADLSAEEKQRAMELTRQALAFARTGEGGEAYFAHVRDVAGTRWYRASPTPGESDRWFFTWLRPLFAFDVTTHFQTLNMPVLAYFGERDTLVPTRIARQRLQGLYHGRRGRLLTVVEYPNAGHDLRYPSETGDPILAPDYLDRMAAWIGGTAR